MQGGHIAVEAGDLGVTAHGKCSNVELEAL